MFETTAVEVAGRVCDAAAQLAVASRASATWTPGERAAALDAVRASEAALADARAHLLIADRDAGDTQRPGDRSFEAARARASRSGVADATREVRQADALVSMPMVAAGVRDGSVPLPHLDALARVAATSSPEVAALLRTPEAQGTVVSAAGSQSAPDFARFLARYVAAKDPAALQVAHDEQYRERFFSLSAQPNGVFLKGRLDRVAGESLRVALDAMGQFRDDTRSAGQASADALTMLAEKVCAGTGPTRTAGSETGSGSGSWSTSESGSATAGAVRIGAAGPGGADHTGVGGPGGTVGDGLAGTAVSGTVSRPHVSLLVPAETVAELLAQQRAGADVACAPIDLPWSPVPPATLEDGTPVPMSELARVLCEADITRIVMSAEGLPLDVGRTKRLFTTGQRRAVIARDGQCIWNGCEQHASRCEVHHITWWGRDHGATSLTNAALLCRFHHSEVHRLHLTIQRLEKPPGWTRRQQAKAAAAVATAVVSDPGSGGDLGHHGDHGALRGVGDGGEAAARQPMRYVFRNTRGHVVNAPDGQQPGT